MLISISLSFILTARVSIFVPQCIGLVMRFAGMLDLIRVANPLLVSLYGVVYVLYPLSLNLEFCLSKVSCKVITSYFSVFTTARSAAFLVCALFMLRLRVLSMAVWCHGEC